MDCSIVYFIQSKWYIQLVIFIAWAVHFCEKKKENEQSSFDHVSKMALLESHVASKQFRALLSAKNKLPV